MNWLLTIVFCIAVVEVAVRVDFLTPLGDLVRTSRRSMSVLTAKGVSDHWKERAMGAYSRRTFKASLKLAGMLLVIAAAAVLIVLGFDIMHPDYIFFVLSLRGVLLSIIAVTAWLKLRSRLIRG